MRSTTAMAFALGLVVSAPSQADTDAMAADVGCIASLAMMPQLNAQTHKMSDQDVQSSMLVGIMYYMGKITGRDPQFELEPALIKVAAEMTAETVKSNLVRCGGELQAQGKRWQDMGSDMVRRSQEMQKQQNSGPQP
jgi:hypothetical protein